MRITPEYTRPEHLGDPYLGAWYQPGLLDPARAAATVAEIKVQDQLEPVRDIPEGMIDQDYERLVVDLTREHTYPQLEAMGLFLGRHFVSNAAGLFPAALDLSVDEAAVQVYTPGSPMGLGWHRDHKRDKLVVISAVFSGSGMVGFTEKTVEETKAGVEEEDIIAKIHTKALDALFFCATGLYRRPDRSDIRRTHAVLEIDDDEPRWTAQFRMGVNGVEFGNIPVNADAPLRSDRPALLAA